MPRHPPPPSSPSSEPSATAAPVAPVALDRLDRALLRRLQRDNATPQRVLAEELGLSPASVQRRVAALQARGVIAANVAVVEPDAVGVTITALVEVQLFDERAATVDRAKALFRDAEEVQQCFYVTGGVSFVLVICVADMRAYERLTRRLFAENESVKSYRTLVALDRVKAGTAFVIP